MTTLSDSQLNEFFAATYNTPVMQWSEGKAVIPLSLVPKTDGIEIVKLVVSEASREFYADNKDNDPYLFYWVVMNIPNKVILNAIYQYKGNTK